MTFVRPDLSGEDWTRGAANDGSRPLVVDLDHADALDPTLAGAKAAALARARAAGFTTLPGFVITTATTPSIDDQPLPLDIWNAWDELSEQGRRSLVVRSSSTAEDGSASSMAGLFRSVLDVRGLDAFRAAVAEVIASGQGHPIAVLVQPFLEPAWGGVLFGADPVTGRRDRLVLAVVPGGPDRLVSGKVDGAQLTLSPRGRILDRNGDTPRALTQRRLRRQLVRLAHRASGEFGGPQDIEWAATHDGRVVLLQSRPITALGTEVDATGPVFGPGPVAETFSDPLTQLEEDLWVPPLRDALRHTITITGSASPRQLRTSPLVVSVQGRIAADLDLLGLAPTKRRVFAKLDPRPPFRRLRSAWRIGRLGAALPALALDVIAEVDDDLESVPALDQLQADELLRILRRSRDVLTTLHAYEIFAGQLLDPGATPVTAASVALRVIAAAGPGVDGDELAAREPVVLALTPPAIRESLTLPQAPAGIAPQGDSPDVEVLVREALRLRIRWTQELTARAALALGHELVRRGRIPDAVAIRHASLESVERMLAGDEMSITDTADGAAVPPLPAAFRLSDSGVVVPVASSSSTSRGAGGGRGSGPVVHEITEPAPGAVLVVRNLDPDLASVLPGLAGLVAETGSVLSHLAILAREFKVPTVVGFADAVEKFTPGQWVVVDGDTGTVSRADSEEWSAA